MPNYEETLALFRKNGQEHVLAGWEKLFLDQQESLLDDCAQIDFTWLKARLTEFQTVQAFGLQQQTIEPAPVVRLPGDEAGKSAHNAARDAGEDLLRQGKVAAFLVAGGQGTRLGFEGPKGSFPIGPVSGRTLFQWHGEQIAARSRRYGAPIPWYVMTSRENDRETRRFFEDRNFFGLPERDVFFFTQSMVPCLDFQGRLMLASPASLAMNPNGHGGSILGLRRSGALKDMKERGIEVVSYFQVDNPLVTICDPIFLGWHVKESSEMSSKVVEKNSPAERMGVACLKDGKPSMVEYIDLDEDSQRATTPEGGLKFWAGNVAIHILNLSFLERISDGDRLPWHQSRKKVPYFAGTRLIKPDKENAVKFETFVFDALPFAKKTLNLEVRRENEFAPLKNAEGSDSIESCRMLLSAHFCEWLAQAGVSIPMPGLAVDAKQPAVEISPLYSLDAEELAAKVKPEGVKLERTLLLG